MDAIADVVIVRFSGVPERPKAIIIQALVDAGHGSDAQTIAYVQRAHRRGDDLEGLPECIKIVWEEKSSV